MKHSNKYTFRKNILKTLNEHGIPTMELTYRPATSSPDKSKIDSPDTAYQHLRSSWNDGTINLCEEFKVCLLNCRGRILGIATVSKGTQKETMVPINFIMALAILSNAHSIIIAHNHPGGDPTPTQADKTATERIEAICVLLDIKLLDQIIVCDTKYYSFADEGMLPSAQYTRATT